MMTEKPDDISQQRRTILRDLENHMNDKITRDIRDFVTLTKTEGIKQSDAWVSIMTVLSVLLTRMAIAQNLDTEVLVDAIANCHEHQLKAIAEQKRERSL